MSARRLSEREIIAKLSGIFRSPPAPTGIGDDCSVLRIGSETVYASTDMMAAGTHFPAFMKPYDMGRMAAAANLSDIAAMGGRPFALLVSMGIPGDTAQSKILGIARGIQKCASEHGAMVVGGDTKMTSELTISITALGKKTGRTLLRSGAKPGQVLAVTGELGGAAADYLRWKSGGRVPARSRLTSPSPRVREGIALSLSGCATAAIDITDGLALSAWYLSRASGVRIDIDAGSVPVSGRLARSGFAEPLKEDALYHWGGDYELLFTGQSESGIARVGKRLGTRITVIGRVSDGSGVFLRSGGSVRKVEERGYDSFGS